MTVPRLEDVIAARLREGERPEHAESYEVWAAGAAAAWRESCTITTVEQLDALPEGSVIRAEGTVFEAASRPGQQANAWVAVGGPYRATADEVSLPAVLLWHPDWEA